MKLGTCYKLQYNQKYSHLVLAEALSNKLKQISKDRIRLSY